MTTAVAAPELVTVELSLFRGEIVREHRERAGMTQAALAAKLTEMVGDILVLEEDVQLWELGLECPRTNAALAIAHIFDIPLRGLMHEVTFSYSPEWMRRAREDWGLSQLTASRQSGVRLATVRKIESGPAPAGLSGLCVLTLLDTYSTSLPHLRAEYGDE